MIYPYFENFMPLNKPPTLYAILNSKLNFDKEEQTAIKDFAAEGRTFVFNFDYPLSASVSKETFEKNIINHFLERRIGFDTFTSFKIHLNSKLNEIMPMYNKMFDDMANLNLSDDEITTRNYSDRYTRDFSESTSTNSSGSSVDKYSDTPQNQLAQVDNDRYLTDYREISTGDNGTGSNVIDDDSTRTIVETITRKKPGENFLKWLNEQNKIMSKIFDDLEDCFYQLV